MEIHVNALRISTSQITLHTTGTTHGQRHEVMTTHNTPTKHIAGVNASVYGIHRYEYTEFIQLLINN